MTTLTVSFKDDTEFRQAPWKARAHAAEQDAKFRPLYTQAQIEAGAEMFNQVKLAYTDSRVYINYRKKFIAIKVDAPTRSNRYSDAAEIVDKFAAEHSYEKEVKASSIIFHVK